MKTNRILALARNTYKEAVRNRVLYVILVFAILFVLGSRFLASVSVGQDIKILKDMGLLGISLFSVLIAILVGTNIVYQEIERRTIYTVLSKPVQRYEFILGKYLGLCATLVTVVLPMSALVIGQIYLASGSISFDFFVAILLGLVELFVITSVAVLLSCVSSPLLSAVFTFGFYLIGHTLHNLLELFAYIESLQLKMFLRTLYFVLPNLNNFNVHREVVHNLPLPWASITYSLIYAVLYITLVLSLAAMFLRRRDL